MLNKKFATPNGPVTWSNLMKNYVQIAIRNGLG